MWLRLSDLWWSKRLYTRKKNCCLIRFKGAVYSFVRFHRGIAAKDDSCIQKQPLKVQMKLFQSGRSWLLRKLKHQLKRNAVWSWLGELSKAFAPPKPSPSRHYAQRKLPEGTQMHDKNESLQDDASKSSSTGPGASSSIQKEASGSDPSLRSSSKAESQSFSAIDKHGFDDLTRRALAGRFLLAAVSGRVLARSFHAVLNVGIEMIKQALGSGDVTNSELTWNRMQLSVMLEYVQVLVAPTDVDPGAGLKWLALLERVYAMRYVLPLHQVKPLKVLAFNSQNITATMNWNWKPSHRASSWLNDLRDQVEQTRFTAFSWLNDLRDQVEQTRVLNVVFRSATALGSRLPSMAIARAKVAGAGAMLRPVSSSTQVQRPRKELANGQTSRKIDAASLRMVMQKDAQIRLMEKEKNKSPSSVMRISSSSSIHSHG
ncbi:golgi-body localization protein domain-containing protein [Artemisia annua]|uniref:Golgi-body localization protein domain-containing protein n=1 Tax=Artemisia annua TaxID=35608 RepID=A0A2U1M663_ARTAN|nr:golgi-body localization protein domain-containing protein [Artemisia annua]